MKNRLLSSSHADEFFFVRFYSPGWPQQLPARLHNALPPPLHFSPQELNIAVVYVRIYSTGSERAMGTLGRIEENWGWLVRVLYLGRRGEAND